MHVARMDCPHEVRTSDAYRQRLSEEEPSLYSCVVGHFKHYFDTFWIIHSWLGGETFRLPLLLLFQRLRLRGKKLFKISDKFLSSRQSNRQLWCVSKAVVQSFPLMTMFSHKGYFSFITCCSSSASVNPHRLENFCCYLWMTEGENSLFQTNN